MARIERGGVSPSVAILLVPASLLLCSLASATTTIVYPGSGVISDAVENSAPFDTILVSPGLYTHETGANCHHSITVIGMGGAEMNEIRLCSDLCPGALISFTSIASGTSIVEGLNVTPFDQPAFAFGFYVDSNREVVIRNCIVRGLGYGVLVASPNVTVSRNLFLEMSYGIYGEPAVISGNTFSRLGTSVELSDIGPQTIIEANLFLDNYWGIRCGNYSAPILRCNDVWGNVTAYWNCLDPTGQDGNIAADPLVCDPDSYDFRLLPGSPCLPENAPPGCGLIGAFGPCEVTAVGPVVSPAGLRLSVQPNPFLATGEFTFDADIPAVKLEIYDSHGRLVDVLRPVGRRAKWTPGPTITAAGIYFARITNGVASGVIKFALVR